MSVSVRIVDNPRARQAVDLGAFGPPDRAPLAFHRSLDGYAPTPLRSAPGLAELLGVGDVYVKDESSRLGLPSYKVLGASWAIARTVAGLGDDRPRTLVAATDGNHGRAVAHMAALRGWPARIYVPADMVPARVEGIAAEGAQVVVVDGGYDDAVDLAAAQASDDTLVISDTAYPGYTDVPRWVSDGYSTIFWEIDDALAERGLAPPTVVAVQMGVGALAAAVVRRYRSGLDDPPPLLVGVEPVGSECVLASVAAGELVEVPGPHRSIMAGLNCGRASPVAWPLVSAGIDVFLAVPDDLARQAMRDLAAQGVVAGESGAAGLAGLAALAAARPGTLTHEDRVLLLITEGATDPAAYAEIVGRRP